MVVETDEVEGSETEEVETSETEVEGSETEEVEDSETDEDADEDEDGTPRLSSTPLLPVPPRESAPSLPLPLSFSPSPSSDRTANSIPLDPRARKCSAPTSTIGALLKRRLAAMGEDLVDLA
jgi:hypothetical protein